VKKGIYFLRTTDFKLLSRMKVNDCVFLKFAICVTGDHFDYLLRAQTNLGTPLRVVLCLDVIIVTKDMQLRNSFVLAKADSVIIRRRIAD
jgi:hypothetical protein